MTDVRAYDSVIGLRAKGEGQAAQRRYCEDVRLDPYSGALTDDQHFISASTVRDITSLRHDFLSALNQIGFIGTGQVELAKYSVNSTQENLIKSVLVGGLYPRVARIAMPKALFERVQQGAVQKDVSAQVREGLLISARCKRNQILRSLW